MGFLLVISLKEKNQICKSKATFYSKSKLHTESSLLFSSSISFFLLSFLPPSFFPSSLSFSLPLFLPSFPNSFLPFLFFPPSPFLLYLLLSIPFPFIPSLLISLFLTPSFSLFNILSFIYQVFNVCLP